MSMHEEGMVLTIDSKRLIAIAILALITIGTFYSYITALFAFISPYEEYPLDLTSAGTYTTSNNPSTAFSKGSVVRVKGTVEKATAYWDTPPPPYTTYSSFSGSTSCRVFITVIDPNNLPIQFYTTTQSLTIGQSADCAVDTAITSSAPSGTYKVKILVWSDSLPTGVSLTPTIETITFTVT